MNAYQDVFFRSLDLLRGRRTIECLRYLRRSQYWAAEQLRHWQLRRLNALLGQARLASRFWRARLHGLQLPLGSLAELQTISPLIKSDITQHLEEIKTTNLPASRYVMSRTGGSTGEPMFYYWDKRGMDWNRGTVYRSAEWAGTALGERAMQMSGSHFDYDQAQKLHSRLVGVLQRTKDCSVAFLNEEKLEEYRRTLMRFRPTSIWGYASGLAEFARFLASSYPGERYPFVRALITSSETLRPEQRADIERIFGPGSVFDHYGSREMYIGAECSAHDGYHLHSEVLVVEVVDRDGHVVAPGQLGRVLLTDLSNHAFPFIRYDIGDLGVMAEPQTCSCDVGLPKLQRLEGRIADVIVLPDRILTAPNFATLFSDKPGIRAYQIRQEEIGELQVLMEPDEQFSDQTRRYITEAIESMVGGQARVRIVTDKPIAVPESGKRRFVVSKVSREHL